MSRGVNQPTAWILAIIVSGVLFTFGIYLIMQMGQKERKNYSIEAPRFQDRSVIKDEQINADEHIDPNSYEESLPTKAKQPVDDGEYTEEDYGTLSVSDRSQKLAQVKKKAR